MRVAELYEKRAACLVCEGTCRRATIHDFNSCETIENPEWTNDLETPYFYYKLVFRCFECGHLRYWGHEDFEWDA